MAKEPYMQELACGGGSCCLVVSPTCLLVSSEGALVNISFLPVFISLFFFLPSKYLSFKVSEKLALCKLVLCKKHNYLKVYLRLYLLNFIS